MRPTTEGRAHNIFLMSDIVDSCSYFCYNLSYHIKDFPGYKI